MFVPVDVPEKLAADKLPSTVRCAVPAPELAIVNVLSLALLKSKVKEFDELKAYICNKDPEAPNCKSAP